MNYDLIIVGSGPAGIFTALELIKRGTKKKMLLIEKGKPVEKRHCPKAEVGHCVNCKPSCAITTGFSGAGAFSDGKFNFTTEFGGWLTDYMDHDEVMELIQGINDEGKTILIVTHEPDIAAMCKRNVILKDGIIIEDKLITQQRAKSYV